MRPIVQTGLIVTLAGALVLLWTIKPTLSNAGFAVGMAILGIGMGLMISQLGNVVQSSVDESGRSEAGGLQYTGQQLGSSLGVALIGAIVLIGLTSTFISNVEHDPRISSEVSTQVGVAAGSNTNFVASTQIEDAAHKAGLDNPTTTALVDDYEAAQLRSLKAGLLAAALLALVSLAFTRELPHERPSSRAKANHMARIDGRRAIRIRMRVFGVTSVGFLRMSRRERENKTRGAARSGTRARTPPRQCLLGSPATRGQAL